ncbi:MAG: 3'(2'),5'-bisphosphate nucleotidase CysQ [Pseudomonadota bacterium]
MSDTSATLESLLEHMIELALEAGAQIDEIYNSDFKTEQKADGSAVTEADRIGEAIITAGLKAAAADIPILAEEAASEGKIPPLGDRFFLVDPLDGTREFVNRTGEFTINIALIENAAPKIGVVYAPGSSKLYYGVVGGGAYLQRVAPGASRDEATTAARIEARPVPPTDRIAVASRSHRSPETEAFLDKINASDFTPAGSSLKFCLIAEGIADVYPRLGRTMEWDTGAAQAVLEAAGGSVHSLDGDVEGGPLRYNKKGRGFDNPHFIAWGARRTEAQ